MLGLSPGPCRPLVSDAHAGTTGKSSPSLALLSTEIVLWNTTSVQGPGIGAAGKRFSSSLLGISWKPPPGVRGAETESLPHESLVGAPARHSRLSLLNPLDPQEHARHEN